MTVKLIDVATDRDRMSFWRDVPTELYDEWTGDVDSPEGWIGLATVDAGFRTAHSEASPDWTDEPIPGWLKDGQYYVTIDSDGNVWAYTHEDAVEARLAFHASVRRYDDWMRLQAHIEERTGEF